MKIRNLVLMLLCLLFTFLVSAGEKKRLEGSISLPGKDKQVYSDLAKISFQQVLEIALNDHTGKIIEVALEKKDGFLVYEVEMLSPDNSKKEIFFDAGTGKVLLIKENKKKSKKDY